MPNAQLWVDTEDWAVVALELRPNLLSGEGRCVGLEQLRSVGDVCLVQDERSLERTGWTPPGCTGLVGKDVVTETGEYLGKVRDFEFDPRDGELRRLLFDAFGLPFLPPSLVSVYALSCSPSEYNAAPPKSGKNSGAEAGEAPQPRGDILSLGPERVVARAGAERRVQQLSTSLLQRLQLAEPPWEEALRFGCEPLFPPPEARSSSNPSLSSDGKSAFEAAMEARAARQRAGGGRDSRPPARAGIPLMRPSAPFERRDADGGFGVAPPPQTQRRGRGAPQLSDDSSAPSYEQWAPSQQRSRTEEEEEEEVVEMAGGRDDWERSGEAPPRRAASRARPDDFL